MATENEEGSGAARADAAATATVDAPKTRATRREIKGGIPYTTSPGVLKRALELIISAERPDKFGADYMETILKLTGGGARAVPPLLKKMQFIGADGAPTLLYSKFKTENGRSRAAYDGLRNAFGELFRRNEQIYKADENFIKDTIVEITGLKKTDGIVRLMYSTFDAVRFFMDGDILGTLGEDIADANDSDRGAQVSTKNNTKPEFSLGLSYQINIVLPETENVAVFNAIFRSLRDNLLA